jgi:hypothetical protein
MAPTNFQAETAKARAILELAEGVTNGPGLSFVRAYVGAIDEGRIIDPSQPAQIPVKPKVPFQHLPVTNDSLDGREREQYSGPTRGSREWFEGLKARLTA